MEIKLPGTEDREQQYFDNLLARVRDIRASERTPEAEGDRHCESSNRL